MRKSTAAIGSVTTACVAVASFVAGGHYYFDLIDRLPACFVGTPRVIDGDTLECQGRRLRLKGFDTPETRQQDANCREEIALGEIAKCALQHRINSGKWSVKRAGAAGGHDRPLVSLMINGKDVKDSMIDQGVARPYDNKGVKPNWCELLRAQPSLLQTNCLPPNGSK